MTRTDIVERFRQEVDFTKKECTQMVKLVFEILKRTIENGEDVNISGFGIFSVRQKSARRGRNPQTGEDMVITSRRVLTFKPSTQLKWSINDGGAVNKCADGTTRVAAKPAKPANPFICRDWRKRPSLRELQNLKST